jgi:hypothetical protein
LITKSLSLNSIAAQILLIDQISTHGIIRDDKVMRQPEEDI